MQFDDYIESLFYNQIYEAVEKDKLLDFCLDKEPLEIHYIIEFFVKLGSNNDLKDAENLILEKYNDMVNMLSLKCKDKTLTPNESRVLLSILSTSLIKNNICSKEIMNLYLNSYFFKGNRFFNGDELTILNAYFIDFLNQMFNTNVNLNYASAVNMFVPFSIVRKEEDVKLSIAKEPYLQFQNSNDMSQDYYYYVLVFQVYAILHEFCHNLQFEAIIKNKNHDDIERIKKEYIVVYNNTYFYNEHHNNFKFEQEADNFAINNLKNILKTVIPPDMLNSCIEKLQLELETVYINNCNEDKFKILLADEYDKIDIDSRNISNYIR